MLNGISNLKFTTPMSYDTTDVLEHETREAIDIDRTKGAFTFPERNKFDAGRGLTSATVDYISDVKNDPDWVREFRHKALKTFLEKPMPTNWATEDLNAIDFDVRRRACRRFGNLRAPRHSPAGTCVPRRRGSPV